MNVKGCQFSIGDCQLHAQRHKYRKINATFERIAGENDENLITIESHAVFLFIKTIIQHGVLL